MKKQQCRLWWLAKVTGLILLLTACASGPKVRSDYDKSTDFSRYKTFGFASPLGTDNEHYQTIVSQQLKVITRRELEARGLTYSEKSPQLLVNFSARLSDKLRTDTVPRTGMSMGVGGGRGYYGYRAGYYSAWPMYDETIVSSYTEGTLNIDVIDAARKQMVWEGVAVGSVSEKARENMAETIEKVVVAIFQKYPAGVPK